MANKIVLTLLFFFFDMIDLSIEKNSEKKNPEENPKEQRKGLVIDINKFSCNLHRF